MTGAGLSPGPGRTSGDEAAAARQAPGPSLGAAPRCPRRKLRVIWGSDSAVGRPALKGAGPRPPCLKGLGSPAAPSPLRWGHSQARFNASTGRPATRKLPARCYPFKRPGDDTRPGRVSFKQRNLLAAWRLSLIVKGALIGYYGKGGGIFLACRSCCKNEDST